MNLVTSGDITESLKANGVEVDRDAVAYAIRKANVQPIGRAGIVRLFPTSAVVAVKAFLESKRQREKEIPV
jgi:hypothetical protein